MTPGKELLFVALGGSGEIGMNVNCYGTQGKWLMVDCGVTFAGPDYPGIDVVLPDLQFIENQLDDLLGIVLTHGHEDHIGALPYLAADLGVPIYASRFTAGLIAAKLDEEGILDQVELNVIDRAGSFTTGPFTVTFVPLTHSIPEGNALLIGTPYGNVFHTGDWKLDADPVLGEPSTAEELTAIGDAGVLALACDSTNVFNPDASGSEAAVRAGLDTVIGGAKSRVLVTTFASNAARLKTLGEVAVDCGRQLCLAGRSLHRILTVAKASGYLRDFPETIDFDTAMTLPPGRVMIVATGGQGEPRAALSRIADGTHPIKLDADDLVVFSSKQIPGNEVAIGRIQNALAAKGVRMITERQAFIHVSGHPGRPELAEMYRWIRPEILVPVHGEMRHLTEQARYGLSMGIPRTIVQQNGDIVRLAPDGPEKIGHAPVGQLVLDGDVILPADGATLNERRKLGYNGQIAIGLAIDGAGRMIGAPDIRYQGIPVEEDRDAFLEDIADAIRDGLKKAKSKDVEALRESVRLAARRVATRWTGKKPITNILIAEIGK